MATTQDAVRRLRIEVTGAEQASAKLGAVSDKQAAMAVTAGNATKATAQLDASMMKSINQYDAIIRQQAEFNRVMTANVVSLTATTRAANDNSRSVSESGLEWAEWANHIRTAGEAAYALSPKFRGLVNSMAGPALSGATTAIEAAALGIVRGTNLAGKGLVELGVVTARTSTVLAPLAAQMALTGAAMAAWNPTLTSVAASILGRFLPAISAVLRVVAPILIIKDAIGLLVEAWTLGGQKLEEYRQIAVKAAAVDLSTGYFQKITKAAADAKIPVDELTSAFKKLNESTTEKLGGSDLQQRLAQHLKAGNFHGNTGVGAFGQANTTEERFRAIVSLIDQAMQKGQRLAALDLANTAFGPQITESLRKDSEYLNSLVAAADQVSEKQLVSDADVGRALDLQRRYDLAVAILEQRWHPIQNLLTDLGIRMQSAWVGIVEAIAGAVDGVIKLGQALFDKIPAGFWELLSKGAGASVRTVATAALGVVAGPLGAVIGSGAAGAVAGLISGGREDSATDARSAATSKLAAGLKNANAVTQAAAQTSAVYNAVLRDTSKSLDEAKKKHEEAADAVDRAINSVTRHVEQQKADAQAVGLGAAALAMFRVQAAETAAVQANGGKETAEQAARFAQLKVEAGAAADALARAKISDTISRGAQTALLSPDDVQIANQLKSIYPDVATALGSVEAAGLRTNAALSTVSSSLSGTLVTGLADVADGTKSVSQGAADMGKAIIRAIEEMIIKLYIVIPLMRALQAASGMIGGSLGLGSSGVATAQSLGGTGLSLSATGGLFHSGGLVGNPATSRSVDPAVFHGAPRYHTGGIAGLMPDEVPAILQRGERVLPRGQSAGGNVSITINGAPGTPKVTQQDRPNGDRDIMIDFKNMVQDVMVEDAATDGRASRAMQARATGFGGR